MTASLRFRKPNPSTSRVSWAKTPVAEKGLEIGNYRRCNDLADLSEDLNIDCNP